MQNRYEDQRQQKLFVCLCVLPVILRLLLSQLFSIVSGKITDVNVSYLFLAVSDALSWVLPFGIYGKLTLKQCVQPEKSSDRKGVVYIFLCAYSLATFLSILYSFLLSVTGFTFADAKTYDFGTIKMILFVLNSIFLVPISEEFAFRKILLQNLLPIGRFPAIIISAVLFAACHSVTSFVYSIVFGVFLAVVSLHYGVRYSVALHSVNNLLSCIFIILSQNVSTEIYSVLTVSRLALLAFLGLFATLKIIKKGYCFGKNA